MKHENKFLKTITPSFANIIKRQPFIFFFATSVFLHLMLLIVALPHQHKIARQKVPAIQVTMVPWHKSSQKLLQVAVKTGDHTKSPITLKDRVSKKKLQKKMGATPKQSESSRHTVAFHGDVQKETTVLLQGSNGRYAPYLSHVRDKINHCWVYPPKAKSGALEGTVLLKFTIGKDGSLLDVSVLKSSEYAILDDGAVMAVRHAGPFGPLPSSMSLARLTILATFIYQFSE